MTLPRNQAGKVIKNGAECIKKVLKSEQTCILAKHLLLAGRILSVPRLGGSATSARAPSKFEVQDSRSEVRPASRPLHAPRSTSVVPDRHPSLNTRNSQIPRSPGSLRAFPRLSIHFPLPWGQLCWRFVGALYTASTRLVQGSPKRERPICGEKALWVFHVMVQFEFLIGVREGRNGGLVRKVPQGRVKRIESGGIAGGMRGECVPKAWGKHGESMGKAC